MSSNRTQADPLVDLIAQQVILQTEIDRLMAQRATPPLRTGNTHASASTSVSVRVSALNRLGNRHRRFMRSHDNGQGTMNSRTNEEQESSDEYESV